MPVIRACWQGSYPPTIASALANHNGCLWLNNVESMSDEVAALLALHQGDLGLGLKRLSEPSARALINLRGDLWLGKLADLSDEAARVLMGLVEIGSHQQRRLSWMTIPAFFVVQAGTPITVATRLPSIKRLDRSCIGIASRAPLHVELLSKSHKMRVTHGHCSPNLWFRSKSNFATPKFGFASSRMRRIFSDHLCLLAAFSGISSWREPST